MTFLKKKYCIEIILHKQVPLPVPCVNFTQILIFYLKKKKFKLIKIIILKI